MAIAYDTLGFAKHLTAAGMPTKQANALAEAIREKVMPELATRADIIKLEHLIERQTLQLTVRLGGLIVAGVGILAAIRFFV